MTIVPLAGHRGARSARCSTSCRRSLRLVSNHVPSSQPFDALGSLPYELRSPIVPSLLWTRCSTLSRSPAPGSLRLRLRVIFLACTGGTRALIRPLVTHRNSVDRRFAGHGPLSKSQVDCHGTSCSQGEVKEVRAGGVRAELRGLNSSRTPYGRLTRRRVGNTLLLLVCGFVLQWRAHRGARPPAVQRNEPCSPLPGQDRVSPLLRPTGPVLTVNPKESGRQAGRARCPRVHIAASTHRLRYRPSYK